MSAGPAASPSAVSSAAPLAEATLARLSIDRQAAPLRRRRPWWRRWWVWALALALLAGGAFALRQQGRATPVEIGTVTAAWPSQSIAALNATGRVVAARRASVSSKASGRLEWLGVQEGQRVKQGDVIARLENRDVGAQREQAAAGIKAAQANLVQGEAELEDARAALVRAQELAAQKFIAASAVDTAAARFNKARAGIQTLQAQIAVAQANWRVSDVSFEQTLIRAPFTGMVLTKNANVGDILTPFSSASGTTGAVVTMADMSTLEVEADVSEASIGKITLDQPAEIQLDAFADLRLLGSVSRIVPTVDRSKATLLVKVRFDETDARTLPDMSARVAFLSRPLAPAERKSVAALRPEAVVQQDGRAYVFVVGGEAPKADAAKDAAGPIAQGSAIASKLGAAPAAGEAAAVATVTRTAVVTGARVGDLLRVENLAPGTRVVINPPARLADGERVTPAKK